MITYLKTLGAFILVIAGFFLGKSRQQLKSLQEKNESLNANLNQEKRNVEAIKNANNLDFVTVSSELRAKTRANRKRS